MSEDRYIPMEFRKHDIVCPEDAAAHVEDIIGFLALDAMRHRIRQAKKEGRTQDADFYAEVLYILENWYLFDDDIYKDGSAEQPPDRWH